MRKFFYSLLFLLVLAASFKVVTAFFSPREVQVTVTEPLHIETKEISEPLPQPVEKEKIPEVADLMQRPQNTAPKIQKTPVKTEIQEKKISVVVPVAPKKEKESKPVALPEKKYENKKSREPPAEKKSAVVKNVIPEKSEKKIETPPPQLVDTVEYENCWLEDFEADGHLNGVKYVDNWNREGGVLFTPKTDFYLKTDKKASAKSVLVIESRKSSAVFACDLSKVIDLNETPILRWRWRVKKLPPFGDGRHKKRDDQAIGIYIGTGTAFNQKAVSYRWETETPVGHWGKTLYTNVMNVWFYCLRNKYDGLNVWYEESRNVRQDFLDKYGFVPEKIALVICGNSQNSKSDALAEIDYIGFYKEVKKKGKK